MKNRLSVGPATDSSLFIEDAKVHSVAVRTKDDSGRIRTEKLAALRNLFESNTEPAPPPEESPDTRSRIEKMMNLRFEEFEISPDASPEALDSLGALYTKNLIPNAAFEALPLRDLTTFKKYIQRGGMLNRWNPTEREREVYGKEYVSVRDQMHLDLTGKSGKPGTYRVFAYRDPKTNDIRGWLSARFPAIDDRTRAEFSQFLEASLFDTKRGMHIESPWDNRIRKRFPDVLEIDTVNTERGWEGLGPILMSKLAMAIKSDIPDEHIPKMLYLYRFAGLDLLGDEDSPLQVGQNDASSRFVQNLNFTDVGYRRDPNEVVVREVQNQPSPIVVHPRWAYSSVLWQDFDQGVQEAFSRMKHLAPLLEQK
jgi:hypothetical protein